MAITNYALLLREARDQAQGRAHRGTTIFNDILVKGIRAGEMPARSKAARSWYRDQAQKISRTGSGSSGVSGASMIADGLKDKARVVNMIEPGMMYTFAYDPKYKDTLPYYDRFPLIFPINKTKGGFMGINFHYLPPRMRAQLMDALYGITNNKRYDETTRLSLSYDLLNSAAKFRFFKPALKQYLNRQMKSRFIFINPTEWDIALFLPLAQFEKASKQKVYADSRRMVTR
jgi:hypothetical protein